MLFEEITIEEIAEIRAREAAEEARTEGLSQGLDEAYRNVARNSLSEGVPIEIIQKITGLDMETIQSLK